MNKKFIITKDELTAIKLKNNGFQEVSNISGVYVFLNQPPTNFNFDNFDKTKMAYTNMLSM